MTDVGIKAYRQDLRNILDRWRESLERSPQDDIARDSSILRFELSFEVAWKLIQQLGRREGFEVNSPRQAFQQAFSLGWIADEEIWKDILQARNTAIHVYRNEYAEALAGRLPAYFAAFVHLRDRLQEEDG